MSKINREYFFDKFPYHSSELSKDTINKIMDYYEESDEYCRLTELAYVLATTFHESASTWNTNIKEYGKGKGKSYGVVDKETGQIYYGRSLCQITWRKNYEKFSKILGIDLVNDPDLALGDNGIKIMMIGMARGIFTGKKLSDYFTDTTTNWISARKIINSLDRANLIAGYAQKFYSCLQYSDDSPEPIGEQTVPDEVAVQAEAIDPIKMEDSEGNEIAFPATPSVS